MSIYSQDYIPYFYIIQETINGRYYAGAKWGKNANPTKFMVEHGGYYTSSKIINDIVRKHGIGVIKVLKIRTFTEEMEAYNYETRFLQKIDAKNHPLFLNYHNNDAGARYQKYKDDEHPYKGKKGKEVPWYGVNRNEDSKKRYAKSKTGDKNPSACEYWIYNDKGELVSYFKSNFVKNAMKIINHRPTVNALIKSYKNNTKLEYKKKGVTGPYPIYDRKYDGWYAVRKSPESRIKSDNANKGKKHYHNPITNEEIVSHKQPPGFIEGRLPSVGEKISVTRKLLYSKHF